MSRFKSEKADAQRIQIMQAIRDGEDMHEFAIEKAVGLKSPRLGDHIWKLLKSGKIIMDHYNVQRKDGIGGRMVTILRATSKGKRWLKRQGTVTAKPIDPDACQKCGCTLWRQEIVQGSELRDQCFNGHWRWE